MDKQKKISKRLLKEINILDKYSENGIRFIKKKMEH